jgi:hypothetical protein
MKIRTIQGNSMYNGEDYHMGCIFDFHVGCHIDFHSCLLYHFSYLSKVLYMWRKYGKKEA